MASDGWALVLFRVCPQNIGDGGHDLRPQPYLSPGLVCRCLVHDQPETWGPAIFGTLFERSLDPARRSLIGAHYTSEEDILLLIEPVLMRPLEQRWAIVRQRILEALEIERAEEAARNSRQARLRTDLPSQKLLADWIDALTSVRVKAVRRGERHRWRSMRLDPALCASAVLSQLFRGMSLVPTSPAQIKCAKNIYVLGRNWPRATRVRLKHWSSWRFKHTRGVLPSDSPSERRGNRPLRPWRIFMSYGTQSALAVSRSKTRSLASAHVSPPGAADADHAAAVDKSMEAK